MTTASLLRNPIERLTTADARKDIGIEVVPMSLDLALRWDRRVQPLINGHYAHATDHSDPKATRADVGWNWERLLDWAAVHNFGRLPGGHGPALAMSIVVTSHTDQFPIGMLTTVPQYRCSVAGASRQRAFAWFLADAPTEAYVWLGIPAVKNVALALLDCGIQASLDLGSDGALLLHAAPQGGTKLHRFYTRAGMARLPEGAPPITPFFRRGKSEQYYHFDATGSKRFCQTFDDFRRRLVERC